MGNQSKNSIEINGNLYDATTGKIIPKKTDTKQPATIHRISPQTGNGVVDGFSKPPRTQLGKITHSTSKKAQKSQALMRSSVKKPQPKSSKPSSSVHVTVQKPSLTPSTARVQRAHNTQKSPHVSHHGSAHPRSSVIKKQQELAVRKLQNDQLVPQAPPPVHHKKSQKTKPRHLATAAIIDKALESANSHEQKHLKSKKHNKVLHKIGISSRMAGVSTAILAGLLLGGFFAVQNVPQLSMRVAAARAGFDASMPGYSPSGFSFNGPINYRPGEVTVSFASNTDDRQYSITQRASNWNSDALLANFVASGDKQYQTYLDRGRTLYIYDGSNATWVDNGVWYQVEGESRMTTDQLVRIASSM